MRVLRVSRLVLSCLIPFPVLVFNGCSVFSPIGDAISSGYENTVSYFNVYYNASRLFNQAESEILEAEKAARLRRSSQPVAIPASSKQKLAIVNEKCSNILSFHPTSALVDDALLLVGKSYFYQGDYRKAERKFAELLSQFPESSLAPEGEIWLVRTMIRLGRNEEALSAAQSLAQESSKQGEDAVAAQAFALVGDLQALTGDSPRALESYRKAEELTSDDALAAAVSLNAGRALVSAGEFRQGAVAFLKSAELADDPLMQFEGKLEALRALRAGKEYGSALQIAEELLNDYRFSTWSKEVLFERALTYAAQGDREQAMDDYWAIDSTSTRTEIGAKAAFELARVLENQVGDYRRARDAYSRALSYPVATITPEARRRQNALSRYFLLHGQMSVLDSLMEIEFPAPIIAKRDSVGGGMNAARVDSLRTVKGRVAYDLGEVFYSELEKVDSAVFWYREALASSLDSSRSARILFVLAEIARTYPEGGYGNSRAFYQRLLEDYPNSPFAREAKIQMGMEVSRRETDRAESLYTVAERLVESGESTEAVRTMERLIQEFPWSPYAAKSRYAIGWIYEYRLQQPDSALAQYKAVIDQYGNTTYASTARARINAEVSPDTSAQLRKPGLQEKGTESEKEDARSKTKQPTSKEVIKD